MRDAVIEVEHLGRVKLSCQTSIVCPSLQILQESQLHHADHDANGSPIHTSVVKFMPDNSLNPLNMQEITTM